MARGGGKVQPSDHTNGTTPDSGGRSPTENGKSPERPDDGSDIHTFEDLMGYFGVFGRWQFYTYFLLYFLLFWGSVQSTGLSVFIASKQSYHCDVGLDEDKWTHEQRVNFSKLIEPSKCFILDLDYSALAGKSFSEAQTWLDAQGDSNKTRKCEKVIFEKEDNKMHETMSKTFNLACDDQKQFWAEGAALSINKVGMMIGLAVAGTWSDRYGRKKVFYILNVLALVFGVLQAVTPWFPLFIFARFMSTVLGAPAWAAAYTINNEITSAANRAIVAGTYWFSYGAGYSFCAPVAYLIRDWRIIIYVATVPGLILFAYWWMLDESPRWLLTKNKAAEAEKVIRKAARWNKKQLPKNIDFVEVADRISKAHEPADGSKRRWFFSIFDRKEGGKWYQFKYGPLIIRAFILFLSWNTNALNYYGLTYYQYSGNVFVNNGVQGLTDMMGNLVAIVALRFSRRWTHACGFAISAICLFTVPWIPEDASALRLVMAMFAKCCAVVCFTVVYMHTAELYPTVIRTSGLATSSAVGRCGSILAPFIAKLPQLDPASTGLKVLPFKIMGCMAVLACISVCFLPETKGKQMPNLLEDALVFKDEVKQNKHEMKDMKDHKA